MAFPKAEISVPNEKRKSKGKKKRSKRRSKSSSKLPPEAGEVMVGDWRELCIKKFSLVPVPKTWLNDKLSALTNADNETWKRYYHYRDFHKSTADELDDEDDESDDPHDKYDDDSADETCGTSISSLNSTQKANDTKSSSSGKSSRSGRSHYSSDSSKKEFNFDKYLMKLCRKSLAEIATEIGIPSWTSNWKLYLDCDWDPKSEDLISAEYSAIIFSPFAIPHAIEVEHFIRNRFSYTSNDFKTHWMFKLVRFDGLPNGDEVQQNLAKLFPKKNPHNISRGKKSSGGGAPHGDLLLQHHRCLYDPVKKMEYICSNRDVGSPQVKTTRTKPLFGGRYEEQDISNFNATTVRRIRQWLLGSAHKSTNVLDDYDLLSLIFASCGTPDFHAIEGSIGYEWNPQLCFNGRATNDLDEEEATAAPVNWLEYQARLVSGKLRPGDRYYKPYSIFEAKRDWSQSLFNQMSDHDLKKYLKEGESIKKLEAAPWMLWDRAEEENIEGGGCTVSVPVPDTADISRLWDMINKL